MQNELVLIRGLPGSGKSTLAKQMNGYTHIEADMYFIRDGKYRYNASEINAAHRWCQDETREALLAGDNVVVSNTFTRKFEIQPYIDMAKELGVRFRIIVANGNYKNIHDVPDFVVNKMRQRWENL